MEKTDLLILRISPFSRLEQRPRGPERPRRGCGTSDAGVRTGGEPRAPACGHPGRSPSSRAAGRDPPSMTGSVHREDRKSTRLNSSHVAISYAVFCLKKKKNKKNNNNYID